MVKFVIQVFVSLMVTLQRTLGRFLSLDIIVRTSITGNAMSIVPFKHLLFHLLEFLRFNVLLIGFVFW